jgi:predicted Zn-dependent protease
MRKARKAMYIAFGAMAAILSSFPALAQDVVGVTTSPAPPLSAKDKRQAEIEMKEGADGQVEIAKELKLDTDPALLKRVTTVGNRLAAVADSTVIPAEFGNDKVYPFVWHFYVVDSKDVNAFSIPGGYVFVNKGLLDAVRSDDELAGVLGHEMTHSAHHHIVTLAHIQNTKFGVYNVAMMIAMLAAMSGHGGASAADIATMGQYAELGIMNNQYSEQAERDADHGGTIMMAKAGYDPVGMLTFMERLGDFEDHSQQVDQGIFQNHPVASERIALIRQELAEMHVPITAKAIREVSGGFVATVSPGKPGTEQVIFDKQPIATLADPTGTRAQNAADLINNLLDNGLQNSQVEARADSLVAANEPVITFTGADSALTPGSTPESLASQADAAFQKGLWDQSFVVASPGQ